MRISPSISVAFLVSSIGVAGAACVDLFHSTADLRTECEMTPAAAGCRGAVEDATVASSSGICKTREIARALANQACAWLGACEGPIGRNAFGSCVVQARLAFDCAANPNHPIKGHEADLWMCLANVQSCGEVSACIFPDGTPSCSEIGSSCRGSPDGGPTGDVRFECSQQYTLDGGADSGDGQPAWVSYAEDCALFGQTCSMDGNAAVCAGSGGATGCASESCPGGASTNLIWCPNSSDQGLDCASNGAQRCGGFPKNNPTWLACVPQSGDAASCSPSVSVTCDGGYAMSCPTGVAETIDCAALLEDGAECAASELNPAFDWTSPCSTPLPQCTADECDDAGGLVGCLRGSLLHLDCGFEALGPCALLSIDGTQRVACTAR